MEKTFRSGFVAIVGRPNVGKSTLINALVGEKVSIVSDKPNTTRNQVRGVMNREGVQVVLVDTPGIHKPKSALGNRLNQSANDAITDVDLVVVVVDGSVPMGPGDLRVLNQVMPGAVVAVNKVDRTSKKEVFERLAALVPFDASSYFPISAKSGEGVDELADFLFSKMEEGPAFYPESMKRDITDTEWIAELVREALLKRVREEIPHSIATMITEVEGRYIRCEIFVERDSQKAIVLGRGGVNVKEVGIEVRKHLPPNSYLDLVVKVAKDWQSRSSFLDDLGL
ncbi:MAG: GTPase Era [Actinomycetota bacterium]|nr:GTPase Era [Actinomycetota bacterium]